MKLKIYKKLLNWLIKLGIKLHLIESFGKEVAIKKNTRISIELNEGWERKTLSQQLKEKDAVLTKKELFELTN